MTTSPAPVDPTRRAALLSIKLRALVSDHLGSDALPSVADAQAGASFGRGAALIVRDCAWVLLDEQPERGLGAALAWATRQSDVRSLAVIAEASTGILARRAALFEMPITVWQAQGRSLVPAHHEPYPVSDAIDPAHEIWRSVIEQGGAEPVVEHGVLAGEIRGLEVCRVVTDAYSGEVRLEVGVGAHDRESFMMLHGNKPTAEALAGVVDAVSGHRQVDAPLHPLNRLGAERFLRWLAINDPSRVGAVNLRSADPPVRRPNLKDPIPCVAVGRTANGAPLVAVCSVGIDLDLVPFALDAREMYGADAELVLVVPERDASPVTQRVAALARGSISVLTWA